MTIFASATYSSSPPGTFAGKAFQFENTQSSSIVNSVGGSGKFIPALVWTSNLSVPVAANVPFPSSEKITVTGCVKKRAPMTRSVSMSTAVSVGLVENGSVSPS